MGTSKRKINAKIKNILKDTTKGSLNDKAVEITEAIVTKNRLNETIENENSLRASLSIVYEGFSSLSKNGYKGKSKEELKEEPITRDEFMDILLQEINNQELINSEILEKALKKVMIKFFDTEFDAYIFTQLLFYQITYELLINELIETLSDSIEDISYEEIKKMAEFSTNEIVDEDVHQAINDFVDRKKSLSSIFDLIVSKTNKSNFGEF